MKLDPHVLRPFVLAGVIAVAVACGSDTPPQATAPESEAANEVVDLGQSFDERDIVAARAAYNEAWELWNAREHGRYEMTIKMGTFAEVRVTVGVDGVVANEKITVGTEGDVAGLPRTVDRAFGVIDELLTRFEEGSAVVAPEGECGEHLNVRFSTTLGHPSSYDRLGPCDDGVGIEISVELLTNDGESAAGSADDSASAQAAGAEPELVAEGFEAIDVAWQDALDNAAPLDTVELGAIDGFEAFRTVWELPDGRLLATGRWDGDEPIARWYQPNPDAVAPGEEVRLPTEVIEPPVRLFVIDLAADAPDSRFVAISHVPEVRPFNTAIARGEAPDVVLDMRLQNDGTTVVYTAGFSGAAYDIAEGLYVTTLPTR